MKRIIGLFVISMVLFVGARIESERISARKCSEYNRESDRCTQRISPLLGYRPAMEREFPHSALIGKQKNSSSGSGRVEWFCSGILISPDYVLTLAECGLVAQMSEATHVRLGDFNYASKTDDAASIDVEIDEVIINPNRSVEHFYDNIALLRLRHSVLFNAHIWPACLSQTSNIEMKKATMTGWLFKLYSIPRSMQHKQDRALRKYDLKLVSNDECQKKFSKYNVTKLPNGITETILCAEIIKDEEHLNSEHFKPLRPLEQVDGAPLQYMHDTDRCLYTVFGISQVKPAFGLLNVPMVFTRIYPYLPWIETIVWPKE